MDGSRFDDLARSLAAPMARRGFLGSVLAGLTLALRGPRAGTAQEPGDCPGFQGIACQGEFGCGDGPNGFCPSNACCAGVCTDLLSDDGHCGSCGAACPDDATCTGGQCAPRCREPLLFCGGACVDPASDAANCGGCGDACGGGTVCVDGSCRCPDGLSPCQGGCVDTQTDRANCGGCGVVCPPGGSCVGGSCDVPCPQGTVACGDACVDILSDPSNCGGCGVLCPPESTCAGGVCDATCPQGTVACGGECVDPLADPSNCGGCGVACPPGSGCAEGICEGPVQCPDGSVACGEVCVEVLTDASNCGGCGVVCQQGESCCDGRCAALTSDPLNCGACGATCTDGTSCIDGSCPAEESGVETTGARDVPRADLCVARPRSPATLRRLARADRATPTAVDALSAALTPKDVADLLGTGERVGRETREAVTAATWGALGCENKGDVLAGLGALTDEGARLAIAERGWTPEILDLLEDAIPAPLPSDLQVAVVGNPAIREMTDGRVAVRVRLDNPLIPRDGDGPGANDERVYILKRDREDWRIDRIVPVSREPVTPRLPGEIRVQVALCPPGMGYDDFVAGACPPHHASGFAFTSATLDPYTPASPVVTCCSAGESFGYLDCCADVTWEGETQVTTDPLPLGATYWLPLSRGEGEDQTAWLVPGALGISFPSLFADPVTLWGVSLTAARPRALLTAYVFRDAACGSTCAGDEASCPEPVTGFTRWVDLSTDQDHCGTCGTACGDGARCVRGRCEPGPVASPEATP